MESRSSASLASAFFALLGASTITGLSHAQCTDADEDGFLVGVNCGTVQDCNDADDAAFPGAIEVCDGRDSNCNGLVDDHPSCRTMCSNAEPYATTTRVSVDNDLTSDYPVIEWVGDGWVVAYHTQSQDSCTKVGLRKIDPMGNPRGAPLVISGGGASLTYASEPKLRWNGSRLLVVWTEPLSPQTNCTTVTGRFGVAWQVFDGQLRPQSAILYADPSCSTTTIFNRTDVVWGRDRFAISWEEEPTPTSLQSLHVTTLDQAGVPTTPCGPFATGSEFAKHGSLGWSGDSFGLAWAEFGEIYFRRFSPELQFSDPAPIRLTLDPAYSDRPALVWADAEWGLSFSDTRSNAFNLWDTFFARLTSQGSKLVPPGDVQISVSPGGTKPFNSLAWTGAEYGVAYDYLNEATSGGDILLQRVSPTGGKIGTAINVTPDTAKNARQPDLAWNGKEFAAVYTDYRPTDGTQRQVYLKRIGCQCADLDGDHLSSCSGGDCNDNDPFIKPGAIEVCLDGKDNNCDGQTDCQSLATCPASGGALPSEVTNVIVDPDHRTLRWAAVAGASSYDVLTGAVLELASDANFDRARCLAWRVPGLMLDLADVPLKGKANYFLVRSKADTCRLGTWGSALRDAARLICP